MSDWIEDYMDYTDGLASPEIYRQWAAIGCVAGLLERRVWVRTSLSMLYPNLYILLVGAPGTGKTQAIDPAGKLWHDVKDLHISPKSITKAGLIDCLRDAPRKLLIDGKLIEFHSLQVPAGELGVLLPAHDLEFLSVLNDIYDNPSHTSERRRGVGKEVFIPHPQLTILAGSQPGFMASLFPEEAWTMGFASRLLMIYAANGVEVPLFGEAEERDELYASLLSRAKKMLGLFGAFSWEPKAKEAIAEWKSRGLPPIPKHSKLQHYILRRILHLIKLCMISAVSRGAGYQPNGEGPYPLEITLADYERAKLWLLHAEGLMGDIFREMVGRSDNSVLSELLLFVWQLQRSEGGKPVHENRIWDFLRQRVPSDKIQRIIETAEKSSMLIREAGTVLFKANAKHMEEIE